MDMDTDAIYKNEQSNNKKKMKEQPLESEFFSESSDDDENEVDWKDNNFRVVKSSTNHGTKRKREAEVYTYTSLKPRSNFEKKNRKLDRQVRTNYYHSSVDALFSWVSSTEQQSSKILSKSTSLDQVFSHIENKLNSRDNQVPIILRYTITNPEIDYAPAPPSESSHREKKARSNSPSDGSSTGKHKNYPKNRRTNIPIPLDTKADIKLPIRVKECGTEVTCLGDIPVSQLDNKHYWSTKSCLYVHPYPIGYRAHKTHWNRRWEMEIQKGPKGPLFIVRAADGDDKDEKVFKGPSATKPWTDACLANSSKGTRVSGPRFFGFSSPAVQKALHLKGEAARKAAKKDQGKEPAKEQS
eukprot:TRINITY_DN15591_c0_g1_i1.p1 TRINITY_DN15591_c0_g1~~TRINITY_DN15591_c0_g1_i1.p1  ORF type:complete len:383 (-),score=96.64 TRINITY_DN15591_c0_g1_i1:30-1094(-)